MKKVGVFLKLSFRYWKVHFKRMITLAVICILGTVALCFSCLYIRSEKALIMEEELTLLGDYDVVVYGVEETDISLVAEQDAVSSYGFYRELGYADMGGVPQCKVASFPDERSEQMYHMVCIDGAYPQKENEIAIDADTAKKFGVPPMPGQKIVLTLYDIEGNGLGDREYTISGVFQASSAGGYGGFYRYPIAGSNGMDGYSVPSMFVFDSEKEFFQSSITTVLLQTESDIQALTAEMEQADFSKWFCDAPMGRTMAYSYILGLTEHITSEYGEMNISSLLAAIRDGNVWKDFYSSVLIPMFAALILAIVMISVFSIVWDIIMGRLKEVAILRSLCMTKQGVFLYLFSELTVFIIIFLALGLIIGSVLHYLLVQGMNVYFGIHIPLGFHVNTYVASVTPQPWLYAAAVIGISGMAAMLLPLLKMSKSTPVSVFRMKYQKKETLWKRHVTDFSNRTWQQVISRHIRFHERSVLVIMVIIMCAAFFGYNYFKAFTDKENVEYINELSASGLNGWDCVAEKSSMSDPYVFLIENHHDHGIEEDTYIRFAEQDFVQTAFARIVNKSTRLVCQKDNTPIAVEHMMDPFSMRQYEIYEASEDPYERTEYEAENAMIEQIGYDPDENIYALPTIGVLPNEFAALAPYVADGEIDLEKIKSGEETVLVVPSDMENAAIAAFHAGDTMLLSDIVLSEEEEHYPFSSGNPFDYAEPVYLEYVEDPSGADVRYASFAFGKRKDIHTKIGAVIVLEDEELYEKFLLPCQELAGYGDSRDAAYGPCLLCIPDTFVSWGLPDRLFTEAKFLISEHGNLSEVNDLFYETFGKCKGLTFSSSFEIMKKMKANAGNTMIIYYILILMLVLLGMIAVGIKFYSRIKLNAQAIAKLRAIGMSLPQIEHLILRQNISYPLIGGVVSLIPTFLCQLFFFYITRQIDSGAWSGFGVITGETPWYHNVPFRYSLFSYHPVLVLLVIVIIFECLMLMATIPQIRYMRKQIIAEMIDTDSF